MTTIDLDARRAAMSEAEQRGVSLVIGGRGYNLAPSVPLAFAWALTEGQILKACQMLVGKDDAEAFLESGITMDELQVIAEAYGADLPNSSARPTSLTSTGPRAKQTSKRTTGRTSRKPA